MPPRRTVDDIPPQERRLDSISWLIQGDDVCGAACFDGRTLLLATNQSRPSEIVEDTIKHLRYVAAKSEELRGIFSSTSGTGEQHKRVVEIKQKIDNSANILRDKIRGTRIHQDKLVKSQIDFPKAINDSLKKITDSIISSYVDPGSRTALDPALIDAIQNNRIEFVPGGRASNHKPIHAEMKLVQKILEDKTIGKGIAKNVYIGISKRCCSNCENVIKAVNYVMRDSVIEESVSVRGEGHKMNYPAGIPQFIDYDDSTLSRDDRREICEEFLRLSPRVDSIDQAFKRTPGMPQPHHPKRSESPERIIDVLTEATTKWIHRIAAAAVQKLFAERAALPEAPPPPISSTDLGKRGRAADTSSSEEKPKESRISSSALKPDSTPTSSPRGGGRPSRSTLGI